MLSILLFAQMAVAPTSGTISASDFPEWLMETGGSYRIPMRILVGLDGRPIWCDVEKRSDDKRLDKYTCDIMMKRARFEPMKWVDDTPTHGMFRQTISWAVSPSRTPVRDLDLTLSQLPTGSKSPAFLDLVVAVDTEAKPVSCRALSLNPPAIDDRPSDPALTNLACRELTKIWHFYVPKDVTGTPLRTLQNFRVMISGPRRK